MVSRGIHQLKNVRLYFCDFGGSSEGVRRALGSETMANFIDKNDHLSMEVYLRRGQHPYISATYINGYVKDVPLRNTSAEETMYYLGLVNSQFGRRSIHHKWQKVWTNKESI